MTPAGQMALERVQKIYERWLSLSERWITVNGARLHIGDDGEPDKGPPELVAALKTEPQMVFDPTERPQAAQRGPTVPFQRADGAEEQKFDPGVGGPEVEIPKVAIKGARRLGEGEKGVNGTIYCEVDGKNGFFKPAQNELLNSAIAPVLYTREVLSHEVDQAIGTNLVPKTSYIRTNMDGAGSFQEEVDRSTDRNDSTDKQVNADAWQKMRILDIVSGNLDRNAFNMILKDGQEGIEPVAIDNGYAWPEENDHSEVYHSKGWSYTRLAGAKNFDDPLTEGNRSLIEGIDYEKVAVLCKKNGMSQKAAMASMQRIAALKSDPEMGRFQSYISTGTYKPSKAAAKRGVKARTTSSKFMTLDKEHVINKIIGTQVPDEARAFVEKTYGK